MVIARRRWRALGRWREPSRWGHIQRWPEARGVGASPVRERATGRRARLRRRSGMPEGQHPVASCVGPRSRAPPASRGSLRRSQGGCRTAQAPALHFVQLARVEPRSQTAGPCVELRRPPHALRPEGARRRRISAASAWPTPRRVRPELHSLSRLPRIQTLHGLDLLNRTDHLRTWTGLSRVTDS